MQEIGFVGLGMMGLPMARNLLQSGYPVRVFNRTQSKADELAREGAILAKTPEEAARAKGGIVITLRAGPRDRCPQPGPHALCGDCPGSPDRLPG